jgi:hypothetical protein
MTGSISSNDRLLLSAIADRLIFGDEHSFRAEDATELARLLPTMPRANIFQRLLPDLAVKGSLPGRSASGFAAGVGNISLKDNNRSFDFDSRGRRVVRAGQWKLMRSGRGIEIEQVMADDGDDGRTALVEFRPGDLSRGSCRLRRTRKNSVGSRTARRAEGKTGHPQMTRIT